MPFERTKVAPGEAATPFAATESLARGLVGSLVNEWDERRAQYKAQAREDVRLGRISKLPRKRAHCYRVLCERTKGLVPTGQLLFEARHGAQTGLDKRAGYAVTFWKPLPETRAFELLVMYVRPGWRRPLCWCLLTVSNHALRRLFFRLRTLDQAQVFAKLEPAARTLCAWYAILGGLTGHAPSVGLPTPRGVLVLTPNAQTALHSPGDYIGVTWISSARMADRPERLSTIEAARTRGGIVLQRGDEHYVVGVQELEVLAPFIKPWENAYYQEMLRHLPGLIPCPQPGRSS